MLITTIQPDTLHEDISSIPIHICDFYLETLGTLKFFFHKTTQFILGCPFAEE